MITITRHIEHVFRHINRLFLLSISVFLIACSKTPYASVELQLHQQRSEKFVDIPAQFVLMNYWATWCKPCIKEIPELNALDTHSSLAIYAYNFDRIEGAELDKASQKFNLKLSKMLNEPAPLFDEKTPGGLPATLVINKETGAKQWLIGPQTEQSVLAALMLDQSGSKKVSDRNY